MLEDEYKQMMAYFKQTVEGESVDIKKLCEESLDFFEKVQEMIEQGSSQDKDAVIQMMAEMHDSLLADSKKLTESMGMTEEELMQFAENASNFDAEQWGLIQKTRESMSQTGESLASYIKKGIEEVPKIVKRSPTAPKKRPRKSRKDSWLRS